MNCFQIRRKRKSQMAPSTLIDGSISKRNLLTIRTNIQSTSKEVKMEIHYVLNRIIVVLFESECDDVQYRRGLKDVTQLLRKNHLDHYKVFNLSKKRSDIARLHPVVELGWPQELSPPLDRLCSICKLFENWLAVNTANVIVLHSKGVASRVAIVMAAYMHYINICSLGQSIPECRAMQLFVDKCIGASGQPSHKRYISYFASLLSGITKINPSIIYLKRIVLVNCANRNLMFKIYERMQPVYTTQLTNSREKMVVVFDDLPLRGDILVKCFEKTATCERAPFFRCQFNTCTFDTSSEENFLTLRFYKEELDEIFSDPSVCNQAAIDFVFQTNESKSPMKRSVANCSRADSYENFDNEEEDRSDSLVIDALTGEYSPDSNRPAESTDSGICSEPMKDKRSMPPVPPPKPRTNHDEERQDKYTKITRSSDQITTREHSVLPAVVRPVVSPRSVSPVEERPMPQVEPHLIAKGRYDPASKCFSYAPAQALNQHFTTPRRVVQWRKLDERSNDLDVYAMNASDIANVSIISTELNRQPVAPKWDNEIDKIVTENSHSTKTVGNFANEHAANSPMFNGSLLNSAVMQNSFDEIEKPIIDDLAKKVVKKRQTKFGSYKTLNDDCYSSDMDDLCDPEFYLSYGKEQASMAATESSVKNFTKNDTSSNRLNGTDASNYQNGISSAIDSDNRTRRKPLKELSQSDFKSVNDVFPRATQSSVSLGDMNAERDAFRQRHCRSATSTLTLRDVQSSRLFRNDIYNCLTDAENADDWLKTQFEKLKAKRQNNPEILRRKRQEKKLLEELKQVSNDRLNARGTTEKDWSVEGHGNRSDPVAEYRLEEEKLHNTKSPFIDRIGMDSNTARRLVSPSTNYSSKPADFVRHKPPTPPPRAPSRSPPPSPYPRRSRTKTPIFEPQKMSVYRKETNSISRNDGDGLSDEYDWYELNHQRSTFQNDRPSPSSSSTNAKRSILKRRVSEVQNGPTSVDQRNSSPYEDRSSPASNRASTPAFPVRKETPLPYHPLLFNGASDSNALTHTINHRSPSPRSQYFEQSRRASMTSLEGNDVIHHHSIFVKDTSKYWYKPSISREEAINMLRDKPPGTFVVRDSNSFPGAFGLALKVATPPPGVHPGDGTELVRHFLIEPSPKGVKLKGCNNEPVFGSLSALVYQHSITPLALPTKLLLPEYDPASTSEHVNAAQALLQQGAACNVTFIASLDTESLTGPEAVRRCISEAFNLHKQGMLQPVSVHFKVSAQGVTITDNTRRIFFRRHYPVHSVTFAGIDPSDRKWDNSSANDGHSNYVRHARIFAFVARKLSSRSDNACHIFSELEPEQPASAVVNFITKVMMTKCITGIAY